MGLAFKPYVALPSRALAQGWAGEEETMVTLHMKSGEVLETEAVLESPDGRTYFLGSPLHREVPVAAVAFVEEAA
jgi:hypothetical protein